MDTRLIRDIEALRDLAIERGTKQGLNIYELAAGQLANAASPSEVCAIQSKLKDALVGIDAHGIFTPAEFAIVKRILDV